MSWGGGGGGLKSRGGGGGHVNFHVASRGVGSPLTLTFQQGGGGVLFKLFH